MQQIGKRDRHPAGRSAWRGLGVAPRLALGLALVLPASLAWAQSAPVQDSYAFPRGSLTQQSDDRDAVTAYTYDALTRFTQSCITSSGISAKLTALLGARSCAEIVVTKFHEYLNHRSDECSA